MRLIPSCPSSRNSSLIPCFVIPYPRHYDVYLIEEVLKLIKDKESSPPPPWHHGDQTEAKTAFASATPPGEAFLKGALVGRNVRRILRPPQRPSSDAAGRSRLRLRQCDAAVPAAGTPASKAKKVAEKKVGSLVMKRRFRNIRR